MIHPVILSGGVGKRLWPVSSQNNPKQLHKLFNDKTLLQNTYNRVLKGFDRDNIFVVTNKNLVDSIKDQLDIDDKNILTEPQSKSTAIAIGLAAAKIKSIDPEANLVIINSDHFIKDEEQYIDLLRRGEAYLDGKYNDKFILAGIRPSYPETGYGYIEVGQKLENNLFLVDSFKEKPDLATAKEYINDGFLWNSALFFFKASNLLDWYAQYLPQLHQALLAIASDFSPDIIAKEYKHLEDISIDVGLLEKMDDILVMPSDISWADIGHWRSLRDILKKGDDNVSNTKNLVTVDSHNNLLYSFNNKKLIATVGVEDMILVETDEAILLCPANRAQDIKALLTEIKNKGFDKYL